MEPLELVTNMIENLQYIPQRYAELNSNLSIIQGRITDLEHYIENEKFNAYQGFLLAKELKDLRMTRRQLKNEVDQLEHLNQFVNNNRKLEIDLFKVKTTMAKIKDRQDNWTYTPRVPEEGICSAVNVL